MNKIIILIFALISILNAENNKKITLQLSWLHQFQFAGYYIAKEKGFYSDVNIDVNLKEFNFNTDISTVIDKKEADFAIGRSSLLIDKLEGKDIVALLSAFQHSPMVLLTRKDSKINTIEDLRNKKIMITSDAKNTASILAMLNANNLKEEDLNIIPHSFNLDDLISGKTDAMASYLSNEPIRLQDKNIEYNIFNPKDYGFDFYSDILFTSSTFIKKNPVLTKDFYDATIKGWEYAFDNVVETAELIHKKYNSQNKSLIHLIKEGEVLKNLYLHKDGDIGCLEEKRLNDILSVFKVLGITNKSLDVSGFVYEKNNHKTIVLELSNEERNIIILAFVFILMIFSITIYFLRKIHLDKKLLDSVINSSDDLIYYKDKHLKYLGCNKAFEDFVGKEKSDIIGKKVEEIFDKNNSSILAEADKNVVLNNQAEIISNWFKSSNGIELFLQNKKIPFKYGINDIGILGVCRDLTKLKELEKLHLEQQKSILIQSKIVAMGEMLENIAHQWRQPLSVITTSISGIKLSIEFEKEISKETILNCSEEIMNQSNYLSQTIEDFKSFFNTDESIKKEFNLKDALLKMQTLIIDSFSNNGIKIILDLEDHILNQNENSLVQSLVNICNNSKDAIVLNDIDISKRYLFVNVECFNDKYKIIIKDSAGGIPEDIIDKLFEPYFTTKHQSVGTGIGLYMTNQLITKQYGGEISVSNVKYKYNNQILEGAEFIIDIPLK